MSMLLDIAPLGAAFLGGAVVGTAGLKSWISRAKTQLGKLPAKLPTTVAELKSATSLSAPSALSSFVASVEADVKKL